MVVENNEEHKMDNNEDKTNKEVLELIK